VVTEKKIAQHAHSGARLIPFGYKKEGGKVRRKPEQ